MQYTNDDGADVDEVEKVVWGQHVELFLFFNRVRSRWRYKQVSTGMGSTSIPFELNWTFVEKLMARTPAIKQLNTEEFATFFENLEVMESAASQYLQDAFMKQLKRAK